VHACKVSKDRWACFLYDFVIDQEATPSGEYSIPSYCAGVCGGGGNIVVDQLGKFMGRIRKMSVSQFMCECMFKPYLDPGLTRPLRG
jgi:hypothetical protein